MDEEQKISLTSIKDGAVVEMFDRCIDEVLENISDPNTEARKSREIVLKVKFSPTEDRGMIGISAQCATKLLAQEQLVTSAFVRNGAAYENKPRQRSIFPDNVQPIPERSKQQ